MNIHSRNSLYWLLTHLSYELTELTLTRLVKQMYKIINFSINQIQYAQTQQKNYEDINILILNGKIASDSSTVTAIDNIDLPESMIVTINTLIPLLAEHYNAISANKVSPLLQTHPTVPDFAPAVFSNA